MHSGLCSMTKENLKSTKMMKIAGQRANSIPIDNHEFSELVWENGQVYVQSLPRKSQESPSFANVNIIKKRFGTVDEFLHDKKSTDSLQENKLYKSSYQTHFNVFLEHNEGNTCDTNLTDSQIVPVDEYADTQLGGSCNLRETPQFNSTSNNQPYDQSSLQQYCNLASVPFKRQRVLDSSMNRVLDNSKSQEQDLEYDGKRDKVNFSLFLRSPLLRNSSSQRNEVTVPTNSTSSSSRSKKLKNNIGCEDTNVEVEPLSSQPPKKSVPDDQSEAVSPKYAAKEKLINSEKSMEPRPVASSSFCSRGASNNPIYNNNLKRRYHDTEWSADLSDQNVEEKLENARKQVPARGSAGSKRKRIAELHNQSERKRRDKINKKMRALQELIPNCNKVDKASMLDEAIEYLKTLQLQVQMMSMGPGVCLPQMMIPTGMQQIHAPQMAHFSPMGVGMGMRMHMGGALGCSPHQFLTSPIAAATAMAGITQNRIQVPGFAPQPLPPMSLFRSPLGLFHKTVPVAAAPVELMGAFKLSDPNDPNQKINCGQERNNATAECSKNQPSI